MPDDFTCQGKALNQKRKVLASLRVKRLIIIYTLQNKLIFHSTRFFCLVSDAPA